MTAIATTKDFQERLYEKIRADIGSLMTDEELKKLVETTMQRVFFTPEVTSSWGRTETKPPKIEQIVAELMGPSLVYAVQHPAVASERADALRAPNEP